MIVENAQLTPREQVLMEAEKEENRLSREHAIQLKQLELAISKEENAAQIELKKLEAKWSSWLKIPVIIIKLPLFVLFGIAYIFSVFTKKEMPKRFWDLLSS